MTYGTLGVMRATIEERTKERDTLLAAQQGILAERQAALADRDEAQIKVAMLLAALTGITKTYLGSTQVPFPQCVPTVKAALVAIATATGKSTFGNDWMDALDNSSKGA